MSVVMSVSKGVDKYTVNSITELENWYIDTTEAKENYNVYMRIGEWVPPEEDIRPIEADTINDILEEVTRELDKQESTYIEEHPAVVWTSTEPIV